jgi:hypothetical protein
VEQEALRVTASASAADPERRVPMGVTRPQLWPDSPPGRQPRAFDRLQAEEGPLRAPKRMRVRSWIAVGLMLLGAVLLALAVALPTWWLVPPAAVVGLGGAVLALKSQIFAAVNTGQSPTGGG